MKIAPAVSIVLPLYKPTGNWANQFVKNVSALNEELQGIDIHYIVVHDGPPTEHLLSTFEVIAEAIESIQFLHYKENRGKGYALRLGVLQAITPYVITTDFDFPYVKEDIAELFSKLQLGYEVVIGKRNRSYFSQLPVKRKVISKTYAWVNRLFFNLPVYDTQSGLKGFNVNGRSVFLQTRISRFLVDTEFLIRTTKKGLLVDVIDVNLRPDVSFTNFGWGVLKTETRNLLYLIRLQATLRKKSSRRELSASSSILSRN
ncbi:MAG: hypothetical protein JWP88_268 [Flaviaesturariibacter sp.]|nr:hypothetical protein [Flaviaesturariibacter sp.]